MLAALQNIFAEGAEEQNHLLLDSHGSGNELGVGEDEKEEEKGKKETFDGFALHGCDAKSTYPRF